MLPQSEINRRMELAVAAAVSRLESEGQEVTDMAVADSPEVQAVNARFGRTTPPPLTSTQQAEVDRQLRELFGAESE